MEQRVKDMLMDTLIHKEFVSKSCRKMAAHFFEIGEDEKGLELLQRAAVHDNSKLSGQELEDLSKISDNFASMKDANVHLDDAQKALIALHYKNNTHYPEHWGDVSLMPEMDVVEMVCDWHARSCQFGTDLIDFVITRQQNRFHFPPDMFNRILEYCNILVS